MKDFHPSSKEVRKILQEESCTRLLPENLDPHLVCRYGASIAASIECHPHLERAMSLARVQIAEKEAMGSSMISGHTILAQKMTSSKGRFTRTWHAPEGGLWGCVAHANTLLPLSRRFIPFAVGIACCETMHIFGAKSASLRWVNDVLVDGKKIAGFLVESYTAPQSGEIFNLIGFGINLNNSSFPEEIRLIATSLGEQLGTTIDVNAFAETFLAKLAWNIGLLYAEEEQYLAEERYSGEKGRHYIIDRFLALTDVVGQRVVYGFDVMESPQYEAQVLAVDNDGGLVLQLDDGYHKTEYSGEVRYL